MADVTINRGRGAKLTMDGTAIGQLTNIGEIGGERATFTVELLDEEYVHKMGDQIDSGTLDVSGVFNAGDAGQTALDGAFADGELHAFVATIAKRTFTFDAIVKSFRVGEAAVGNYVPFAASLDISGKITTGAAE